MGYPQCGANVQRDYGQHIFSRLFEKASFEVQSGHIEQHIELDTIRVEMCEKPVHIRIVGEIARHGRDNHRELSLHTIAQGFQTRFVDIG